MSALTSPYNLPYVGSNHTSVAYLTRFAYIERDLVERIHYTKKHQEIAQRQTACVLCSEARGPTEGSV